MMRKAWSDLEPRRLTGRSASATGALTGEGTGTRAGASGLRSQRLQAARTRYFERCLLCFSTEWLCTGVVQRFVRVGGRDARRLRSRGGVAEKTAEGRGERGEARETEEGEEG